jgi:predicted HAD superfamily phosphohydrolase YqeG
MKPTLLTEKTSFEIIPYTLKTLFKPSLTNTLKRQGNLEKFEDINVDEIMRTVRAMILDVDGTLTCGTEDFTPQIVEKLREIKSKIPACVYCNQNYNWPVFEQLGIPVARHLPNKPDPHGFNVAMDLYLQPQIKNRSPLTAPAVAMVGDNYLTDGACRNIGMQFIHVKRHQGPEDKFAKLLRQLGEGIAEFHRGVEKIKSLIPKRKSMTTHEHEGLHPLVKALYEPSRKRDPLY